VLHITEPVPLKADIGIIAHAIGCQQSGTPLYGGELNVVEMFAGGRRRVKVIWFFLVIYRQIGQEVNARLDIIYVDSSKVKNLFDGRDKSETTTKVSRLRLY